MCDKKFKISRLVKLWIKVFVICAGFALASKPTGIADVGIKDFLYMFFPVGKKAYWFVTCYFGMILFSPLLNVAIEKTNKKQLFMITALTLFVTSFWFAWDTYDVHGGYDFAWFVSLYLVAGYIKKHVKINEVKCPVIWYIGASLFTFLWGRFSPVAPKIFFDYNSISMLIASVGLFVTFAKMNIGNKEVDVESGSERKSVSARLISFFAPLTFGVYLIHMNDYFLDFLWEHVSPVKGATSLIEIALRSIVVVFAIFIACALADFVITKLLDLIVYKRGWYQRLMARADGVFDRRLSE